MSPEGFVSAFLDAHVAVDSCDDCLAAKLGIPSYRAREAMSRLAESPGFDRGVGRCTLCHKTRKVMQALPDVVWRSGGAPALSPMARHRLAG
jgi:hypothetical protein